MSANTARGERRRRLLQDGLLTSQNGEEAHSVTHSITATGRRYVLGADNLALRLGQAITPTSTAAWSANVCGLLALVAATVAAQHYQNLAPQAFTQLVQLGQLGSLSAWLVTAAWGVIAALSLVVFQMRRRRNDDFRGRYKWWLAAGAAALLLSVDGATHWRSIAADAIASSTGTSALRADAYGCATLDVVLFGLVAMKVLFDLRDQRGPFVFGLTALICFGSSVGLSAAGFAGLFPAGLGLAGATFALLAPWSFVRGIVREVAAAAAGEMPAQARRAVKEQPPQVKLATPPVVEQKPEIKAAEPVRAVERPRVVQHDEDDAEESSAESSARTTPKKQKAKWVSGAKGSYRDNYEADDEERAERVAKDKKPRRERSDRRAA
jgi:hypothetical protein